MPGITFRGVDRACRVALVAIRPVNLLAQDRVLAEAHQHTAQGVGQIVGRGGPVERGDQIPGQGVVVQLGGQLSVLYFVYNGFCVDLSTPINPIPNVVFPPITFN